MDDPDKNLTFMIQDVARLMRRNFNRRVGSLALTQAQWQALAYIKRNPGISQSALADIIEVQPISVARLIDRMEAAGWVERRPDPDDRRAVKLYVQVKSGSVLEQMAVHGAEMRGQAMQNLNQKEKAALLDMLTRMRANLAEGEDTK